MFHLRTRWQIMNQWPASDQSIPSKIVGKNPVLDANTDKNKLEQESNLNFMLFNKNNFNYRHSIII